MIIKVIARKAYGQVRFYPANAAAKEMAELTRTETFTFRMLLIAKRMGAELELAGNSHIPTNAELEYSQYHQLGFLKEE